MNATAEAGDRAPAHSAALALDRLLESVALGHLLRAPTLPADPSAYAPHVAVALDLWDDDAWHDARSTRRVLHQRLEARLADRSGAQIAPGLRLFYPFADAQVDALASAVRDALAAPTRPTGPIDMAIGLRPGPVVQHNPDLTDDELQMRIHLGQTPDERIDPAFYATRFASFVLALRAWDGAVAWLHAAEGLRSTASLDDTIDRRRPRHALVQWQLADDERPLGVGFEATGAPIVQPEGDGQHTTWPAAEPLAGDAIDAVLLVLVDGGVDWRVERLMPVVVPAGRVPDAVLPLPAATGGDGDEEG
ncbi:MAG: hypothetical protein AAF772_10395 [Acidobacteriota bacterium]